MRSRFSAFAVGDAAYLLQSWHPRTRPAALELDDSITWASLEVLSAAGGPFDTEGAVEFRAHFRRAGQPGTLHERSTFVRENGQWYYVDGLVG